MPEQNKEEIEKLMQQLKVVKDEVFQIKKQLISVGKEKEKLFAKKKEISNKIRDKISEIRGSKVERNSTGQDIRKSKNERDKLNKEISKKIAEIKVMKKAYGDIANKNGIKGNPNKLLQEIEKFEYRLETEPMSFDKEQKLMKQLKDLKKKNVQFTLVKKEWEMVRNKSKEIDELKLKANEFHKQVQNAAKLNQNKHNLVVGESKEIDELKEKEEEAYKSFFEQKTKFKEINSELKAKLKTLQEIKNVLESNNVALKEEETKKREITLKEKTAAVEDKISKRKKLTTEDLLVMQRNNNK